MPDPDPMDVVDRLEAEGLTREQALAEVRRQHDAQLSRNGWVAHIVFGDPDTPHGFNACTYGLSDSFGHPDFQIVAPLPPGIAGALLAILANEVKAGRRFAAGSTASKIIQKFTIGFALATEDGRELLRVIIPDKQGRTARGEIGGEFSRQYEGTW